MKVICMTKPIKASDGTFNMHPGPEVGDEDVVIGETKYKGNLFFYLERFGDDRAYLSTYFATLSDADQLKEEEETAIVNLQPA